MTDTRYTITTKGNVTTVIRKPAPGDEQLPLGNFVYLEDDSKQIPPRGPARPPKPKRKKKR